MKVVIPAHAGMILTGTPLKLCSFCYTRTRGDDPSDEKLIRDSIELYPHTRG